MLSVKSSFGGFTSPYVYIIPADSVILYNGTYSAAVDGWDIYSAAANSFIVGTATQGEIATATAASGSTVAAVTSLATAGLHYGSGVSGAGGSGSASYDNISAGDHTHTVTPASITLSTEMKPISTTITMLRTLTEQRFFPANTIHINGTNLVSGTQKLAATSNRYVSGGSTVTDNAATSHAPTFTVATISSGSHNHTPYVGSGSVATGYGTGASNPLYVGASSTFHNHVVAGSASITALKGKLLKLWIAAARQLPKSATVVMYCGNLSLLPSYWKVCDGTNGTMDMQGYFVGYATSSATAHGAVTSESTTYSNTAPTAASDNFSHAHYVLGVSTASSQTYPHGQGNFAHTHTVNGGSLTTDAFPANIKLAFIQLVI